MMFIPSFPTPGSAYSRDDESQFRAMIARVLVLLSSEFRGSGVPIMPADLALSVINKTGSDIAANKVVAVSSLDATSGKPKIVLSDADVFGGDDLWVTSVAIPNDSQGTVYKSFLSSADIDTSGATTAGDPVYLSTTAGGFAHAAPSGATARVQPVGMVVVKNASVGQLLWDIGPVRIIGTNELQAKTVTVAKANVFFSAEQTGTGASQNVAHGLGVAPTGVLIVPTDIAPATLGDYTAVEAAHDGTNVKVTVTLNKKFKVFAWA